MSDIILNRDQSAAVAEISAWVAGPGRFLSLSGPAGSGKTTILRALKSVLGDCVTWSAMTGRAARRMREASGVPARTLHSALYHVPREVDNTKKKRIDLVFEEVRAVRRRVLVVDESSMVDRKLLADVERSPAEKILLVGDGFQIPPVSTGDADDWSVFRQVPGPRLTEVVRTSGAVVEAATRVREERRIPTESVEGGGSIFEFQPDFRAALRNWFDDRDDHVLITWKNERRMNLNRQIRQVLGHPGAMPDPGEPVVVRRNSHQRQMMNGDIFYVDAWLGDGPTLAGIATRYVRLRRRAAPAIPGAVDVGEIDPDVVPDDGVETILTVIEGRERPFDGFMPYVELRQWRGAVHAAQVEEPIPITYGYALTGHLVQGSEYRRATTLLFDDARNRHFCKMTALPDGGECPFALRWVYTALTRAKEKSTLVGE